MFGLEMGDDSQIYLNVYDNMLHFAGCSYLHETICKFYFEGDTVFHLDRRLCSFRKMDSWANCGITNSRIYFKCSTTGFKQFVLQKILHSMR